MAKMIVWAPSISFVVYFYIWLDLMIVEIQNRRSLAAVTPLFLHDQIGPKDQSRHCSLLVRKHTKCCRPEFGSHVK